MSSIHSSNRGVLWDLQRQFFMLLLVLFVFMPLQDYFIQFTSIQLGEHIQVPKINGLIPLNLLHFYQELCGVGTSQNHFREVNLRSTTSHIFNNL